MIYFAQIGEGGPIKIGFSDDVPSRLAQLESHYGRPMILLGTEPGGKPQEASWHARLAPWRFGRTEQFRPVLEVLEAIGRPLLVSSNPETVETVRPRLVAFSVSLDFAEKLKQAAGERGMTAADFCDRFLSPCVEKAHRDYIKAESKKLAGDDKGP